MSQRHDVVIIGAGLAGLTLARHLLLASDKTVLLLDRRATVPPPKQKVGEATVQLSAYYYSKVLDLEEHLLREHFLKYNLRFYWKTPGRANDRYEDYSQSYIRALSNIATYQLDRNKIEAEVLRLNRLSPRFTFRGGATDLDVTLSDAGPHAVSFRADGSPIATSADWVVDTSGRGKFLARRLGLDEPNAIRHGTSFLWVDGLLNIEKLTDSSPTQILRNPDRARLGHLPVFLATNHFCGEGFWFWTIPLQGKTSLGLVYDRQCVPEEKVNTPARLVAWVCEQFPLFARDLPARTIVDHGSFRDYSYSCRQTISPSRWALSGEAGRFTDPLYSPGGDLISLHNTLIVDAILTPAGEELDRKCAMYEPLMRALYEAYVPSYAVSYDVLGDQEAMTLKYSWELAIYFSLYVFPFVNGLFTDRGFVARFMNRFSRLGPINRNLQRLVSDFFQWKKDRPSGRRAPVFNDFTDVPPLRRAERAFYDVGVTADEARELLDGHMANLEEMAQFIAAYVAAAVVADPAALTDRAFVKGLDPARLAFDPAAFRARYAACAGSAGTHAWSFETDGLRPFMDEWPVAAESALAAAANGNGAP
jgi:2-polyprenyl-6-methoxyphenol hydroxylase-like FAD-dependent oxidoreductase